MKTATLYFNTPTEFGALGKSRKIKHRDEMIHK
jgi:hypothetical protein